MRVIFYTSRRFTLVGNIGLANQIMMKVATVAWCRSQIHNHNTGSLVANFRITILWPSDCVDRRVTKKGITIVTSAAVSAA